MTKPWKVCPIKSWQPSIERMLPDGKTLVAGLESNCRWSFLSWSQQGKEAQSDPTPRTVLDRIADPVDPDR